MKGSMSMTGSTSLPAPTSVSGSASMPHTAKVTVQGARGVEVTLTGPIAAKYQSATPTQKKALGQVLTGDRNAGKRASGVVFQQFAGGVISAKNDDVGTLAYITWGRIRDAWNVERDPAGRPSQTGKNGSAGPLGYATSDELTHGTKKVSTFAHGKISYDTKSRKVVVTVNGKIVPSGL
ncbi:LGFP repeat-containing protein [Gordonia sp. (in: high G+C Gram-positive bacteria)]|uniref:LGFP repeat-containing protein n=1 Tax=Gordonia sp. (in: high G+C Gram-positive bacteria) TaxID=84139 RepID=UPI0039E70E8C